jgi:hypothetical protein
MKRLAVPAVPFILSLCLSAATVGTHAYWQDSALYLTAIKEWGVLYPPGFVLYEVLCRLWTLLLPFVDFTLAVHLFSSVCAAAAAGTMALATRDLLRTRGAVFQVTAEDPGEVADACGILSGVILACGFTFWSNAIYAKGYALYYLILTLLIWRMIRADESGRPRDFLAVAALIGLAWQVHPSATLLGGAFLLFVASHRRPLGVAWIAGGAALAAICALGPSLILLPWLLSRDPWLVMGMPSGVLETLKYVTGKRFVSIQGVFGLDGVRVLSFGRFLGEEFLVVGSGLLIWGFAALVKNRSRLLWGIAAWTIPYAIITILFKIEGQHDCWFVAAWMPFYPVVGIGAWRLSRWKSAPARTVLLGTGAAAIASAVLLNGAEISQRGYTLAESYGRALLDPLDRDAVLVLSGDDSNALVSYLQRVRGDRPDVVLVTNNFLDAENGSRWYEEGLARRSPDLRIPDYDSRRREFPNAARKDLATAAFLAANLDGRRALFSDRLIPPDLLPAGYRQIPSGVSWKLVKEGPEAIPNAAYWTFPIEPEEIHVDSRRARGQKVSNVGGSVEVEPQRYEERLRSLLVLARFHLAMAQIERGQFLPAARLCESIIALDPQYWNNPVYVHNLAISLYAVGEKAKAERALRRSAEISTIPRNRATANFLLGELARARKDETEARRWYESALSVPGLDGAMRREIESRLKTP